MPKISAIIHTHNDAQRIGRALDSLRPCDEVLVIDHGSSDDTGKIAREHGATVKKAVPGVSAGAYALDARHDWILCLLPGESLSEALEASLYEWKARQIKDKETVGAGEGGRDKPGPAAYSIAIREESGRGWRLRRPESRLVNRRKVNWAETLPPQDPKAEKIPGELLRFKNP